MELKTVINKIRQEVDVLTGDKAKNKRYASQHTYPDERSAQEAFVSSKAKLFDVNRWSDLSSFTADFSLHDQTGNPINGRQPQAGDYVKIELPGPIPENWVEVIDVTTEDRRAEFTVKPSRNPHQNEDTAKIDHFFQSQARSTFRVDIEGCTISAYEIGQHEAINNQKPQSGDRAIINTLVAEAGWLFHQLIQWQALTDYLVDRET